MGNIFGNKNTDSNMIKNLNKKLQACESNKYSTFREIFSMINPNPLGDEYKQAHDAYCIEYVNQIKKLEKQLAECKNSVACKPSHDVTRTTYDADMSGGKSRKHRKYKKRTYKLKKLHY